MPAAEKEVERVTVPFSLALIAGGFAGTTVDVALYPLDALKTRLQSPKGFWKAGGFSGIYRGVLATALGASPGSAMFFSAYEGMKPVLKKLNGDKEHWLQESFAASCGEVAACTVRVPTAVVTQRMQVGQYATFSEAVTKIAAENGIATFFIGFSTTVAREIPSSFIQFPIYEGLKKAIAIMQKEDTSATQVPEARRQLAQRPCLPTCASHLPDLTKDFYPLQLVSVPVFCVRRARAAARSQVRSPRRPRAHSTSSRRA
jgi:hypothetical protein